MCKRRANAGPSPPSRLLLEATPGLLAAWWCPLARGLESTTQSEIPGSQLPGWVRGGHLCPGLQLPGQVCSESASRLGFRSGGGLPENLGVVLLQGGASHPKCAPWGPGQARHRPVSIQTGDLPAQALTDSHCSPPVPPPPADLQLMAGGSPTTVTLQCWHGLWGVMPLCPSRTRCFAAGEREEEEVMVLLYK